MNQSAVPKTIIEYQEHLTSILQLYLLPKPTYDPIKSGAKVIHDPLWGSCLFYPWEIALLDTPLCQRLRRIHQLGTGFLTYPSAVHNRFSHSLGVTILAGRLISRLKEKNEVDIDINNKGIEISQRDIYTVRTAGLLHDIGHCFFSHASEKILEPILAPIVRIAFPDNDISPNPHEFIAYLILTNEYFKYYWNQYIVPLFPKDSCPDIDECAGLIIGKYSKPERKYLRDIISGPYDVDKLEYIYRDAKMAGLRISYDIERYFYKIDLAKSGDNIRIVMNQGGISAIEQIIFSKMMLYSFVYHHQKVLASDAIIFDLVDEILANSNGSFDIKHPLDLLRFCDHDLLSSLAVNTTERFKKLKERITCRKMPKRCYVINREFVLDLNHDPDVKKSYQKLLETMRNPHPNINKSFRQEIVERINKKIAPKAITIDELYFNFPGAPVIDGSLQAPIIDMKGRIQPIKNYFNIEGWENSYDLKKLRGYFYTDQPFVEIAAEAIESFLRDKFGLNFLESAKIESKILN
jgi:uncharacterized protein